MSRDELPQYTPNTTVMSFETPPRHLHPLWTTLDANPGTPTITGTGFQSYPAYLATPSSQSHQTSVKRSHKRKSDENSGQSISKKARNSRSLGLLSDSTMLNLPPEMGMPDEVSDPDADKLNCFFAFLQDTPLTETRKDLSPTQPEQLRAYKYKPISQILSLRWRLRLARPKRV